MSWFETKLTYEREVNSDGKIKKVSEYYLVDADTFTDAEARINEIMGPRGVFITDVVRKVKFVEIFQDYSSENYYIARVRFISLDANGVERGKAYNMLVQADNMEHALDNLIKGMSKSLEDYDIISIKETNIVDIFPFEIAD